MCYMFGLNYWAGLVSEQEGRSTLAVNATAGFASAVAATVLTQPTDGLRTRMQVLPHTTTVYYMGHTEVPRQSEML
jgi:hypothetical protein